MHLTIVNVAYYLLHIICQKEKKAPNTRLLGKDRILLSFFPMLCFQVCMML
jgi:hypothetical protein